MPVAAKTKPASPVFFRTPEAFRRWLKTHAAKETELVVGLWRKESGKGGMSYAEALDEALCVGWIDGLRRKIDEESHSIRFTPRRRGSIWSLVNVRHVERLVAASRMTPAGLAAFAARTNELTGVYSFERSLATFDAAQEKKFRSAKKAWKFWEAQPPGYRRVATHWVTSAKQETTRARRLALLIEDSAQGLRLAMITGVKREKKT